MNSIFDKTGNEAIIARINLLTPESQALWGKMSVDQMCKHCTGTTAIAFGRPLKVNFLMKLLGKMMKNTVVNNEFKKNSPTAKEFIFTEKFDLEEAKKELIIEFNKFTEGHQSIKVTKHPFWGKMTHEEWDKLMWNHMDHHLRQFGV